MFKHMVRSIVYLQHFINLFFFFTYRESILVRIHILFSVVYFFSRKLIHIARDFYSFKNISNIFIVIENLYSAYDGAFKFKTEILHFYLSCVSWNCIKIVFYHEKKRKKFFKRWKVALKITKSIARGVQIEKQWTSKMQKRVNTNLLWLKCSQFVCRRWYLKKPKFMQKGEWFLFPHKISE